MKKVMSFLLTLAMIMMVLPTALVSAEAVSVGLTYVDSTPCLATSGGVTHDKLYPIDGDFATSFKSAAVVGGFYTVALDGEYELTTMKIYQDYNRSDYSRLNKVYVSNDGVDFKEVEGVTITATSWLTNAETNNITLARIDYTFPKGTKAKYIKVTNDLETAKEFRLSEMFVYGEKVVIKPKLSSLTVSGATLSPAFDPEITDYEVIFAGEITMPSFLPTVAEGLTVTSEGPDSNNVFKINVSDGSATTTYTFKAVSTTIATNLNLSYYDSTALRAGADNADYAFDNDFDTSCRVEVGEGNYYAVKLGTGESLYEVTELKVFQQSGAAASYDERYTKVYVSENGTSYEAVTCERVKYGWFSGSDGVPDGKSSIRYTFTFPKGTKAKYVKIGNNLTSDNDIPIVEMRVAGKVYVEKPKLTSVTVTGATLSPAFDPDVTYYTLKYDGEITVPQFSYEAAEGLTVTPSGPNAKNEFTITVTDGLGVTTYTVKAVSKIVDNDLTLKCIGHITGSTTTDAALAFDGDFTTRFEAKNINPMSNSFFEIELDDVYELSTMKLYQDTGHADGIFTAFYDKVEVSEDGITYTDISDKVKITSGGWMFNNPETANVAMVRVDYKFTGGTKAKYIKIGNFYSKDLARDFRISELNIYGFIPSAKVYTVTPSKGYLSPEYDFRTTEYTLFASDLKTAIPTLNATVAEGYSVTVTQPAEENNYVGKIDFCKEGTTDILKTYTFTVKGKPAISVDTSGLSFITGSGYLSVYSDLTLYDEDAVLFLVKYNEDGSLSEIKVADSKDKIDDKIQTDAIYVTYSDLPNIKAMLFNGVLAPICEPVTYADFMQ